MTAISSAEAAVRLDTALIRARIDELGIDSGTFARHTGVTPEHLAELASSPTLSLPLLGRIAAVLDIEPGELLTTQIEDGPGDAGLLHAVIAEAGTIRHTALAAVLEWTIDRLAAAVAALEAELAHAGLALQETAEGLAIVRRAAALPEVLAQRLEDWRRDKAPLGPAEAAAALEMVRRILVRPVGGYPAEFRSATAKYLTTHDLAVPSAFPEKLMFRSYGSDAVALDPHPALLFALGLGGPPRAAAEPAIEVV